MTQQSVTDALDEAQESIGRAHQQFAGELKKLADGEHSPFEGPPDGRSKPSTA